jgi:exopolysaccharide biosynthesis polyprenyl glycosylphosphotransferase
MDVGLSLLGLVVVLPVGLLIALGIKLDSRGPVLFRQERAGVGGRSFRMFKFRTMVAEADALKATLEHLNESGDPRLFKIRFDPRVTRFGRFLRSTSLDELPQIINVLRGEMSLVGPRPHALAHDDFFEETVAKYANRQQVKPGITGLAQANGLRGETETREKIEKRLAMDLEYVNSWSLWLDLKIMVMTAVRLLTARDAY